MSSFRKRAAVLYRNSNNWKICAIQRVQPDFLCKHGIVQQLSDAGARGSVGNKIGATAIHVAAAHGHYDALRILLTKEPAAVNIVAATKETAIFWAVKNDHVECARLLLQAGANRLLVNLRKQRPIDVATSPPMREMLRQPDEAFTGKDSILAEAAEAAKDRSIKEGEQTLSSAKTVMMPSNAKTELCRYFGTAHGCARGDKCFFAHGEHELVPLGPPKGAEELGSLSRQKLKQWKTEDFNRKIFVGGLPETADADDLREFFESNFGPVDDAIVIGSQTSTGMHSRGFGFVAFKSEKSAQKACNQHYVVIFGKKVEVKAAVPRPDSIVWEDPPECKTPQTPASVLAGIPESPTSSPEVGSPKPPNPEEPVAIAPAAAAAPEHTPWEVNAWEEKQQQSPGTKLEEIPPLSPIGAEQIAEEPKEERIIPTELNAKSPPWLVKLRQWLPGYLATKRGVQYAMSSLKGDFRACFGLEIPHQDLGFLKLSDFLRSMPDLVKMKIVPTGTGASTHVVLMPRSPRAGAAPPPQAPKPPTKFVSSGRSYASAAQGKEEKKGEETDAQKEREAEKEAEVTEAEEPNELQLAEAPQMLEEAPADANIATPTASPVTKAVPSTPDLSEGPPDCSRALEFLLPRTPTDRLSPPEQPPRVTPPAFDFRKEDREFYLGSPTPQLASSHTDIVPGATARQLFGGPRSPQELERDFLEREMMLQRTPGLVTGRRSPLPPHPSRAQRSPVDFAPGPSPLRPHNYEHLLLRPGLSPEDHFHVPHDLRSLTPDARGARPWNDGVNPEMGAVLQSRLGAIGGGISPGRGLVEGGILPKYCEPVLHVPGAAYREERAREWTPFGPRDSPPAAGRSSFLSWMDWKAPPTAAAQAPFAARAPDEAACRQCWERRVTWAALPCGHRCLCTSCKERVISSGSYVHCNVCQEVVLRWVPLFD